MPVELHVPENPAALDEELQAIPNRPAVFLLWPREGKPYLARTNVLQRRLTRLLGPREKASRLLHLRNTIARIEYHLTGSKLESQFVLWELARRYLGAGYREEIRLPLPSYVKLIVANPFPRTQVTTRFGRSAAVYYGPFRSRSTAAQFESGFLDLFQLRRCQEDLVPGPEHPGCMYGEMGRCLRPCQQAVGIEEYRAEAERVAEFLRTAGKSLIEPAMAERDRLSGDMDFEGAAMMHQRVQRIAEVLALADEMAREVEHLSAIAVAPSSDPESVELGWLREGYWRGFTRLDFNFADGRSVSLDARLRETAAALPESAVTRTERMEQLAILSRWFYSSWRDGEMLLVDDWRKMPWRKLVNAVSRVAGSQRTPRPSNHS
jgi:excinuclease UvrABC nuclease subunit